jgi:multicomponent Na+:H+ antiporter subunit B
MKSLILKEVNRFTVIMIYLFGVYIILHGHLSPGGGFAGGTIISAGMIFYKLLYSERAKRVFTQQFVMRSVCGALLLYGAIKSYHILHGIYTHSDVLMNTTVPYTIASAGSLLILNGCVGVIVAGTFYTLTSLFLEGAL